MSKRRTCNMIVVLIAHSEIATINDPRVTSYTSYQLRLHKRARALVEDSADLVDSWRPTWWSRLNRAASAKLALVLTAVQLAGCTPRGGRHSSPRTDTACLSVSGFRKPSISCPR